MVTIRRLERSLLSFITLSVLMAALPALQARELTLDERVAAQRAIEEVYWRHRIWPETNPGPKPPLARVLPETAIRAKVEDALRKSAALDRIWKRPITVKDLQTEMERMARETKRPETLAELFSALGDDPFLIAECLVRPILADRLLSEQYALHSGYGRRDSPRPQSGEFPVDIENVLTAPGSRAFSDESELSMSPSEKSEASKSETSKEASKTDEARVDGSLHHGIEPVSSAPRIPRSSETFDASVRDERSGLEDATTFPSWWEAERASLPAVIDLPSGDHARLTLPFVASHTCQDDTWTPTNVSGAPAQSGHAAVWTGSEMIIWGGCSDVFAFRSGKIYNPATNSWSGVSTGPSGSSGGCGLTAVWTGSRMIVWGGGHQGDWGVNVWNSGARFDPASSTWAATSTGPGVPSARWYHTAIWTGSRMIVWGGGDAHNQPFDTGGQYDPDSDTWTPTNMGFICSGGTRNGASCHSDEDCPGTCSGGAVPGEPCIPNTCAGGCQQNPTVRCINNNWCLAQNLGTRVNPPPGTCTSFGTCQGLAYLPSARYGHTAVWTGSRMMVWGGRNAPPSAMNSGGLYDPAFDTWTPTSTGASVPSARSDHGAVWTGSEMIVWGGRGPDWISEYGRSLQPDVRYVDTHKHRGERSLGPVPRAYGLDGE